LSDRWRLGKQLESIVSSDRVFPEDRIAARYRFDALRPYRPYPKLRMRGYTPTFLVEPENTSEVSEIVRIAHRSHTPIVPYGGGTGLMGAAVAVQGGIMVDTSRMDEIEEISAEDLFVRAQSGVVLESIHNRLQDLNLFFAHDPWTRPIATLGGAIATNSLGYLGAKYGSIGDQLLGIEAVLPDGLIMKTRPAQFSSTGFDLKRLFVGTEGCYGLITSATVRAFPEPEKSALASYHFSSFEQGYRAIVAMRMSNVGPSMIDYGEESASGHAQLNMAFDGLENEVKAQLAKADAITAESGGKKLDDKEAQEFWDHRHDVALMYSRRISATILHEEPRTRYDYLHLSLPASKILGFREDALRIAKDNRVNVLDVGLWHGPELLSLVLSSRASDAQAAAKKLWNASDLILRHGQDLGGCMEYCHGVGLRLAHLMKREHGLGLEIMRGFKRTVDPLGIMNPGKAAL